jgi:hypothetical protein
MKRTVTGPVRRIALWLSAGVLAAAPLLITPLSAHAALNNKGIVRVVTEDWARLAAAGFDAVTDGGVDRYGVPQRSAGLWGMQFVDGFNMTTCTQAISDAELTNLVNRNVAAGFAGIRYQITDEPFLTGCSVSSVVTAYTHMTQVVHAADPMADTFTADDQFNDADQATWGTGVRMAGAVDFLGLVVFPCINWFPECRFDMIDGVKSRMATLEGVQAWEPVMQDFGTSSWRWPTLAELQTQFDKWTLPVPAGMTGYWVFAWDHTGGDIPSQPGHEDFWRMANGLPR